MIGLFTSLAPLALAADPPLQRVEVIDGGLRHAGVVLQARFGQAIHFEGAPRDVEGVHHLVRPGPNGAPIYRYLGDDELSFSYPADASARQALEAAVAVHNASPGASARYTIVASPTSLDLVPSEILVGGSWEPYASVFDTVVTLPSGTGEGRALYDALLVELSRVSGQRVADCARGIAGRASLHLPSATGEFTWFAPTITLPTRTDTARNLLDAILARSDAANTWWAVHLMDVSTDPRGSDAGPGWCVLFTMVQPEDDQVLNRTPLVAAP